MSDIHTPIDELVKDSARKGKDPNARKLLIVVLVLWLLTLAGLVGFAWNAYFEKKEQAQSLAEQITKACQSGEFGPGISKSDTDNLCHRAKKIATDNSVSIPIKGPRGPQGPPGPPGIQGPQGLQGIMGVRGRNGKDGHEGPKGDPGAIGPIGPQGSEGPRGPIGPQGEQGPQGPQGEQGPEGPSGLINFVTVGCDGPVIKSIAVSYDAETQTATITCN